MSYKIISPLQGSKTIIEAVMQKAGKTLLAVSMILAYFKTHLNCYGYGNTPIDHKRYKHLEDLEKLTPKHFRKDREYIVFIDEGDIIYTWQREYRNEGFHAFWGQGASHGKAAVIMTVQLEYAAMRRKLLRSTHIIVQKTLFNKEGLPTSVVGYSTKPFQEDFKQPIANALNKYDPYERNISRINLKEFRSKVERLDKDEKSSSSTINNQQQHKLKRKATKKLAEALVKKCGNISAAAKESGASRTFISDAIRYGDQ